jgi:hypothetical protein
MRQYSLASGKEETSEFGVEERCYCSRKHDDVGDYRTENSRSAQGAHKYATWQTRVA